MEIITTTADERVPIDDPVVLALGTFDGLHRGHQTVINAAKTMARDSKAKSVVYSFWPHPDIFLKKPKFHITTREQKIKRLEILDVDYLVEQPFTETFSALREYEFVPLLQKKFPQLSGICLGENFRFGKNKKGDSLFLRNLYPRFALEILESVFCGDCLVSSSQIRECLQRGHLDLANQMLGYTYSLSGTLQKGRGIAQTLGSPTLNVHVENDVLLKFGVYLVRHCFCKSRKHREQKSWKHREQNSYDWGIANFGVRPTFFKNSSDVCLEVHSFHSVDAHEPDAEMEIQFLSFIREEKNFPSPEALKDQIQHDIKIAKKQMSDFVSDNGHRFQTGT